MDPINYQMVNPAEAIMGGLRIDQGINQIQQQGLEKQLTLQKAQLAQQMALQQQSDLQALATKPDAGHADYAALMTKYPALSEGVGKAYQVLDEGNRRTSLEFGSRVYGALQSDPQTAVDLLRTRAKADPAQAQHLNTIASLAESGPQGLRAAQVMMASGLAGMMGPKEFTAAFTGMQTDRRAQEKQPLEVRKLGADVGKAEVEAANAPELAVLGNQNIVSQIKERAARLGLDQDRLTTETKIKLQELGQKANTLDDGAKKIINDATVASVAADQSAGQMIGLADQLDKSGAGYGTFGTAAEWMKARTGNQDAMSQMRQEYNRIRNSQALKSLPPGPASDTDIQLAMKGFPPDTADSAHMASFLRGMAKISQREAIGESARAEWVNAVGHSGKPKTDITVDGVQILAGTTYTDFLKQYLPKAMEKRTAQEVQSRSYMRWADPQPAAPTATPGAGVGTGRAMGFN